MVTCGAMLWVLQILNLREHCPGAAGSWLAALYCVDCDCDVVGGLQLGSRRHPPPPPEPPSAACRAQRQSGA